MRVESSPVLRLNSRQGRILLAIYGAGTTLVAVLNLGGLVSPIAGIASLAFLWAALVILGLPGNDPLSLPLTLGVLGAIAVITVLSSWNVADPNNPGYSAWHLGAVTIVLLVLALRGRRALAWAGFALLAVVTIASTFGTGQNLVGAVNDIARQAGTLAIGTLFALVLRRAGRTIAAIHESLLVRTSREAATDAAARERSVQNERLEREARPALERLLHPQPLSAAELQAITMLEASLRDGIHAAGFSSPAVAYEVRIARERGVRVILVDDRGSDLSDADRTLAETALVTELRMLHSGTVTARLSPAGSPEIASIVVSGDGLQHSVIVKRDSREILRSTATPAVQSFGTPTA